MTTSARSTGSRRRTRERTAPVSCQPGHGESFWLRTKQDFSRRACPPQGCLQETFRGYQGGVAPLIVESNSLLQFLKPSLYFSVVDPAKEDFKDSARVALDRAACSSAARVVGYLPINGTGVDEASLTLASRKYHLSRNAEGEPFAEPLRVLVHRMLEGPKCFDLTTRGYKWRILAVDRHSEGGDNL